MSNNVLVEFKKINQEETQVVIKCEKGHELGLYEVLYSLKGIVEQIAENPEKFLCGYPIGNQLAETESVEFIKEEGKNEH
jgi:hypothetical protein